MKSFRIRTFLGICIDYGLCLSKKHFWPKQLIIIVSVQKIFHLIASGPQMDEDNNFWIFLHILLLTEKCVQQELKFLHLGMCPDVIFGPKKLFYSPPSVRIYNSSVKIVAEPIANTLFPHHYEFARFLYLRMQLLEIKEFSHELVPEPFVPRFSQTFLAPGEKVNEVQSVLYYKLLLICKVGDLLMKIFPDYKHPSTGDFLRI